MYVSSANNSYQKSEISNFGFPFRTRSRARHCRHDDRCQASLSMGGGGGKLLLACFEKVLPWCSHGTFMG